MLNATCPGVLATALQNAGPVQYYLSVDSTSSASLKFLCDSSLAVRGRGGRIRGSRAPRYVRLWRARSLGRAGQSVRLNGAPRCRRLRGPQRSSCGPVSRRVRLGWRYLVGVELNYGFGGSWGLFPQSIPRWARAEALARPTGTTVAALDARRRVPRRPDVVQLDAGKVAGNDRVPLGGRVRSRPRPPSGRKIAPTFTASGTVRPRGRTPSTRASVCR